MNLKFLELEFKVSRRYSRKWITPVYYLTLFISSVLIVLFTFGGTGYEYIPVRSTDFNESDPLWYERIFHDVDWIPPTRTCDASIITANDGTYNVRNVGS